MATTAAVRALASDPLRSFKFNVILNVNGLNGQAAGGEARFGFMSMSGLGVSIEPVTYREGGDNLTTRKMPGQADFNALTFSRGLFPTDSDNWLWMSLLFTAMYGGAQGSLAGGSAATDFRTTGYINILEHPNNTAAAATGQQGVSYPQQNGIIKVSFKLYSAWIGSLNYSDLDAGGNSVALEQMTLNYEGFDMRWGSNGYVSPGW